MMIPHHTGEELTQAISIWQERVSNGELVPEDAYTTVVTFVGSVAAGESLPTTHAEHIVMAEALQLMPIQEGDHK